MIRTEFGIEGLADGGANHYFRTSGSQVRQLSGPNSDEYSCVPLKKK